MGRVGTLLVNPRRDSGLEKSAVPSVRLTFAGIDGDCHGGLTRQSDVRMRKQFAEGTAARNARQISVLSAEVIAKHYPEPSLGFVKAAKHKRGLIGWVEREGILDTGDAIALWLPPQRIYAHA
jgi:hypothetical protein